MMIPRPRALERIAHAFSTHPIAALLGPRQCGKTTLARLIAERGPCTYFDLENPVDIRRLSAPMRTLEELSGLAIIDEIQRRPDLFERGQRGEVIHFGCAVDFRRRSALEQVIGALGTRDAYFWATHGGAELDLLVRIAGKHYGFEFKYADAPGTSRSMHAASRTSLGGLPRPPGILPRRQDLCYSHRFRPNFQIAK